MVDRAWFRLLIRGIGIMVLGFGVPTLVSGVLGVLAYLVDPMYRQSGVGVSWERAMYYLVPPLVSCAVGCYLLFFAEGLIRRCLVDSIGRCPMCHYDVRGLVGERCPECGVVLPGSARSGNGASGGEARGPNPGA